jgi:hypothetical protein
MCGRERSNRHQSAFQLIALVEGHSVPHAANDYPRNVPQRIATLTGYTVEPIVAV